MGGAEGVGPHPLHQVEVPDVQGLVQPLAADVSVLVLAEALEVEGAAVDEEAGVRYGDGADAELLGVPSSLPSTRSR